jgi:4-amino-4-deoxy-L-arabinose transferase-like glycosyltransferase
MSSHPTPALMTRRAAVRLPRLALLLLCAAYVLPGLFGRDPWRNADLASYGLMAAMAEGRSPWLTPTLGGMPVDSALLPHWLGAGFVWALGPLLGGPVAARLPFALLLVATLALVWYASYHLARTEAAQPVAFAFGGEAEPVDYARAVADAALLALIACLGLLQMGHETTPELAQLCAVGGVLWALAAAPYRPLAAPAALLVALPALAASGAPAIALGIGLAGTLVCARSGYPQVRRIAPWVAAASLLSVAAGAASGAWAWRVPGSGWTPAEALSIVRQWAWFLWPAWPAALWTLWRWRHHWLHRHVSVPLAVVLSAGVASIAMQGSDRALMLALPGLAVLAAFALPTLRRSATAAVDWLSMCFFSVSAIAIWVIYVAMHTGVPAKPAANVAKLAPAFEPSFALVDLLPAVLATVAWLWLLRWRTGRHREAVWKSMVLPAGGVVLAWLLLMTLWRPLLDHARSARPWVEALQPALQDADCVLAPGLPPALMAALEVHGGWRVVGSETGSSPVGPGCDARMVVLRDQPRDAALPDAPPGWQQPVTVRRPTDRGELTVVWRRTAS